MLNRTPLERRLDAQGRPYFLWDVDWTDARFRAELAAADDALRVELVAKLMRQAKPDDVFEYVTLAEVERLWDDLVPRLGAQRAFWVWIVGQWRALREARRAAGP
jgi:hypothetical protein